MNDWTPGPWIISEHCATLIMGADGKRSVCSAGGYSTNTLPDNGQGENVANARLIAATPELLEALEGIFVNYRDYGIVDNSWWQAAEEAIAKATGQNNGDV